MRVYICSPLLGKNRGETMKNMRTARNYMALFSKILGVRAVAPHAYLPEIIDDTDPQERELALDFGLGFLTLCDAVIVCGKTISEGMAMEIEKAEKLDIPILYVTDKLIENAHNKKSCATNQIKGLFENEMLLFEKAFPK